MPNSKVPTISLGQDAILGAVLDADGNVSVVRDSGRFFSAPDRTKLDGVSVGDDAAHKSPIEHVTWKAPRGHEPRPQTAATGSLAESIARKCVSYTVREVEDGLAMGLSESAIVVGDQYRIAYGNKIDIAHLANLFGLTSRCASAASDRCLDITARKFGLTRLDGETDESLRSRINAADEARQGRLTGLAAILAWLASPTMVRAVARQRVDRAIADYRGPFARAVAAGLRAAAERCDLSETQIEQTMGLFAYYENRRGGGRQPALSARGDALTGCRRPRGYAWEHDVLGVYERERAR